MNTEAESMISRNWLDRIAILILLVQILFLTGCGARTFKAYTGIERSPAEVAIIGLIRLLEYWFAYTA